MTLQIGDAAPDFDLPDQFGQRVRLSAFAGSKAVLIVFYPFAFSGVCTGELNGFRDELGLFETDDTTMVCISCDPMFSTRAFADRDGLFFPLLSDYWPHGEVTSAYGVLNDELGCPRRSSFVVDKSGKISCMIHNQMGESRQLAEQAQALQAAL